MLAARLPSILPPLRPRELLEVSLVHSIAGDLAGGALTDRRPFRAPHHSASMAALVGGGTRARPGEISLAHHGGRPAAQPGDAIGARSSRSTPFPTSRRIIYTTTHRYERQLRERFAPAAIPYRRERAGFFSVLNLAQRWRMPPPSGPWRSQFRSYSRAGSSWRNETGLYRKS